MRDIPLTPPASRAFAEEVAVRGLAFLAADPERLERFLALSGLAAGEIRAAATRPDFLAGVLHHIMDDDRIAQAFATGAGLGPEDLARAARALGAGAWERDTP
ncbi:DUF3572 family protein [Labrys wisconsinensis]|uniref:DUF3572 domain-containing protein n=1 Tax=Labrys wisconsinensis TaxID=425677 RepID=A0ABU0J5F0_9HYPH|nr:DUF3572 family protein [Labrys wisconsinensis]MDQ0468688.1 hypothetical protein [Labrys wisconsinensis]